MRTKSRDISKKQKVLNYLLRYGSIDRSTALTHCKVWSLGNVVFSLRKLGHDIRIQNRNTENTKYILYDTTTDKPVFSRFFKSKSGGETEDLTEDKFTLSPVNL